MGGSPAVKDNFGPWLTLFETYQVSALSRDLLLRGVLREGLDADSPDVVEAATAWGRPVHFQHGPEGVEVALVSPGEPEPSRLWLHALLFAATVLTTLGAGALLGGIDPFRTRIVELGTVAIPYPTGVRWAALATGGTFAVTVRMVYAISTVAVLFARTSIEVLEGSGS